MGKASPLRGMMSLHLWTLISQKAMRKQMV